MSAEVSENDGSTKFSGASVGSSPPLANITAATSTPMTATPAALAPTTARVELCHGARRLVAAELIDEFGLIEFVVKVGTCHGNRY